MFPALFHMNSYLYTFVGILFWGVTSGIIGMFTVALSGIISFRFKILLFLPVYILLNIPAYMPKITDKLPFDDHVKNNVFFISFLIILFIISIVCSVIKGRGDQL